MLSELKQRLWERAPAWLFALAVMVYQRLHPRRDNVLILPNSGYWLVIKGNLKLLSPDPRGVVLSGPKMTDHDYECYLKVNQGDTVLDVGASVGGFTISVTPKVGADGVVVAIEPDPNNLICLKKNTSKLNNVQIVGKYVSNHRGKERLYVARKNEEKLMIPSDNEYVEIQTDTLDCIVSDLEIERVDFIKMDVEGAELEVLEGAEKTLEIARKVVVAAYHIRNGKKTWPKVQQFLKVRGFKIRVTSDGLVHAWKDQMSLV
jgi:FkbM family methyltransferase